MAEPSELTECFGIDVSQRERAADVPWRSVRAECEFVMVRATHGTAPDAEAFRHLDRCRDFGFSVGLVHLFRPSERPESQLTSFLRLAEQAKVRRGDLWPALDLERDPWPRPGCLPQQSWNPGASSLARALAGWFGGCLVYLSRHDWKLLGRPSWVLDHGLWAPHWPPVGEPRWPAREPAVPGDMRWVMHQYGVGPFEPKGGTQRFTGQHVLNHNRARSLPRIQCVASAQLSLAEAPR